MGDLKGRIMEVLSDRRPSACGGIVWRLRSSGPAATPGEVRAALNELVHEGAVVYSQQLFCYQIAPGSPGPEAA
jgi:hypothetical protein